MPSYADINRQEIVSQETQEGRKLLFKNFHHQYSWKFNIFKQPSDFFLAKICSIYKRKVLMNSRRSWLSKTSNQTNAQNTSPRFIPQNTVCTVHSRHHPVFNLQASNGTIFSMKFTTVGIPFLASYGKRSG